MNPPSTNCYKHHRFPAEIISHGVWLYYPGSTHDKRIADATPYPLPTGSRLLQDLGFLACTLPQVEVIILTKKPRGRTLTRAQKAAQSAHCAPACTH